MSKIKFIKQLEAALQYKLPKDEVIEVISYYEELISDRLDLGELEADIISSLGSIEYIVKVVSIESLEKRESSTNIMSIFSSSKSLLALATTPILIFFAFIFGIIIFSLTVALGSTLFGFVISLVSIFASLIYSVILVITTQSSVYFGLVIIGAHLVVMALISIAAVLIKDLIYYGINKSIEVFTKMFKKKVIENE